MATFNLHTRYCNPTDCIIRNLGTEEEPHYCAMNATTQEPQLFINISGHATKPGFIAVKDYSENTGLTACLLKEGLITGEPVDFIPLQYDTVEIYKYTKKFTDCIEA